MLIRDAKNRVTDEIKDIAKREGVDPERLRSLIASGLVAVPWKVGVAFDSDAIGDFEGDGEVLRGLFVHHPHALRVREIIEGEVGADSREDGGVFREACLFERAL